MEKASFDIRIQTLIFQFSISKKSFVRLMEQWQKNFNFFVFIFFDLISPSVCINMGCTCGEKDHRHVCFRTRMMAWNNTIGTRPGGNKHRSDPRPCKPLRHLVTHVPSGLGKQSKTNWENGSLLKPDQSQETINRSHKSLCKGQLRPK